MNNHDDTGCTANKGKLSLGVVYLAETGRWHVYQSVSCSVCDYVGEQVDGVGFDTEDEAEASALAIHFKLVVAGLVPDAGGFWTAGDPPPEGRP